MADAQPEKLPTARSEANDYIASEGEPFISACCTGNGARALFHVWENMVEFNNGLLRLHLLINRASPWADIDSHIPCEGRVDIKMKAAADLEARIPEWVVPGEVSCSVDGTSVAPDFRGRYALIRGLGDGNLVTLSFPISERTVEATIGDVPYTLIIRGNDVVSIDPPGRWHPFYQRAHYREDQARLVSRQRFVAGA